MKQIGIMIAFESCEGNNQSPAEYGKLMRELLTGVLIEKRDEFAGHAESITIGEPTVSVKITNINPNELVGEDDRTDT